MSHFGKPELAKGTRNRVTQVIDGGRQCAERVCVGNTGVVLLKLVLAKVRELGSRNDLGTKLYVRTLSQNLRPRFVKSANLMGFRKQRNEVSNLVENPNSAKFRSRKCEKSERTES